MSAEHAQDIRLTGAKIGIQPHICAFFHSQEEEYQIMMPFIKEGIERGEKAFHIIAPNLQANHLQRLRNVGLDPDELERRKQLEIRVWEKAYLRNNGSFDLNDMLALIQEVLTEGKREGFPLTRLIAHMEWSLEDRPGVKDIVEYESRLNHILPQFQDPVICVYDLAQFGAATVIEILRTHPMVIIGGILQENPFYVDPDDYLRELQTHKA
ncbi:MAG: MEDS domain-containing protein [Anaerolineae bacterium]|nr:MEDS domain-containing protein [Anaerolineae bacterium]